MYILYYGTPKRNSRKKKTNQRQTPPDAFAKKETSQSRQTGNDPRRGFFTKDLSSTVIGDPWDVSRYLPAKMMDVGI